MTERGTPPRGEPRGDRKSESQRCGASDGRTRGDSRRDFLRSALRKTAYAWPVVVVLGSQSEALANSKDGIAWSQCASFGDPCGAATCCPGYHCVSIPVPMCQPFL
jgi:hypothetical protein